MDPPLDGAGPYAATVSALKPAKKRQIRQIVPENDLAVQNLPSKE
jgi:hypothetical protein